MARTSLKTGTGGSGAGWESAAEPRMRRIRARGKGCAEPGAAAAEGGSASGSLLAACPPGEASGWWAGAPSLKDYELPYPVEGLQGCDCYGTSGRAHTPGVAPNQKQPHFPSPKQRRQS